MLTIPTLTFPPESRSRRRPMAIGLVLRDERRVLAQELVHVYEALAAILGREAATRDPRVRAAARRYRAFCEAGA